MENTPHTHPHHEHEHHNHEHHEHTHESLPQIPKTAGGNWSIPLAIVIAGALIAGAVYFSGGKKVNTNVAVKKDFQAVKPVSADDHIIGNPNAPIVVIEYSDLQCPYCEQFDKTMREVMDTYGKDGKVAWVYRHYWAVRKDQKGNIFHPLGGKAAESSECVAELGGNDKFWEYIGKVFDGQQTGSLTKLGEIAVSIGVDKKAFDTCVSSGKYTKKVADQYKEALASGVSGTPNSFIVTKKNTNMLTGSYPFLSDGADRPGMKDIIEEAIDSI